MDNLIKQRLVGALILVALAVVFWPIIFMPGASDPSDKSVIEVRVPDAPPVNTTALPEPDSAGLRSGTPARAQSQISPDVLLPDAALDDAPSRALPERDDVIPPSTLEVAQERLEVPALDADGLPIAFSLQVATMVDKDRAERLRNDLVEAGYKGYVKRLRRNERVLYRVLVGPKYNRDDLLAIKSAVDSTWRVDSMIIRYLP
ncbi:MAG: SPOR domain-containing protein [Congregibacter sp.]